MQSITQLKLRNNMGSTAEKLKYLLDQYQKGTLTEEQYKIERKLVLRSIKLAKVSK